MRLMAKSGEVPQPSESSVFRFLRPFHGSQQEVEREPGTAVIVPEHARLRGLWKVSAGLIVTDVGGTLPEFEATPFAIT